MKIIFAFLMIGITCTTTLLWANPEIVSNNRVGLHTQIGFGGQISAFYERRVSDFFGVEMGAVGGENFLRLDLSKIHHVGPFVGGNFYFTKIAHPHYLYVAPSIAVTFGKASIRQQDDDGKYFNTIGLNGSLFLVYRYLFSFGLCLETGIGADIVSFLFPLVPNESVSAFALPLPKIEFGISYAF